MEARKKNRLKYDFKRPVLERYRTNPFISKKVSGDKRVKEGDIY